uniref:Alpha 2-macroglobulin n=1 Tax=Penaeus indicus TaxID=29960 RepID=E7D084_PENIN|nr:alpha 2-macroglobulin [Penaeus indicus]
METASLPAAMRATCLWLLMALGACDGSYVITTPRQWITGETSAGVRERAERGRSGREIRRAGPDDDGSRDAEGGEERDHPAKMLGYHCVPGAGGPARDLLRGDPSRSRPLRRQAAERPFACGRRGLRGHEGHQAAEEQEPDLRADGQVPLPARTGGQVQDTYRLRMEGIRVQGRVPRSMGDVAVADSHRAVEGRRQLGRPRPPIEEAGFPAGCRARGGHLHHQRAQRRQDAQHQDLKVREYVLPRFEVEVTPPKYMLGTDDRFNFRACANYTYGQPVKGKMTLEVSNNERRRCLSKYKRTVLVTGCHDNEVTAEELRLMDCSVYSVRATATTEEEGTGITFNATARERVRRTAVTLRGVREDAYKKPNLPYVLRVQAYLPDNTPAPGLPIEVCYAGRRRNRTSDAEGKIIAVVLSGNHRIIMSTLNSRAEMRASVFSKNLEHSRIYFSPSNSALQIQVPEESISCTSGKHKRYLIDIMYSANNTASTRLNCQIIARGKVQKWWSVRVEFKPAQGPYDTQQLVEDPYTPAHPIVTGVVRVPITITTPTSAPSTRDDGEVVSDAAELKVDSCLLYETRLTWETPKEQGGEKTTLSLQARGDALCSVGVVDKSAELLNPDPDPIRQERVIVYLGDYKIYPWINSQIDDTKYCERKIFRQGGVQQDSGPGTEDILPPNRRRYYSEYVDSLRMFSDSGLYVFSDLTLETRPCEEDVWDFYDRPADGGPVYANIPTSAMGPDREFDEPDLSDSGAKENRPRTRFPETWLWDIVVVPSSGVLSQSVTLPDTITEWVGKAVCAHPEVGVGLSEKVSITAFTPFFTDLTIPPSVKRGEILPVKISVFNYLEQHLKVTVHLLETPEYELVEDPSPRGVGKRKSACVAPQDKVVHVIKIRPLARLGNVNLTVSAFTDTSGGSSCGVGRPVQRRDTLIKPIKDVEAEGFLREKTFTKYVCANEMIVQFEIDGSEPDSAVLWELSPPADIVPDSARGWVTVVGDLLALSALQNLGFLIRMPSGCGEQNMINFAPNVYMMQYLTATKQNTPESTEKLLRFMKLGYQRELLYLRSNGSCSAFGNADDSGSTWLTAFVLKSFVQAKAFIYIDDSSLNRTRVWLMDSELDRSGCVIQVGKVFSKGLKGGLQGKGSPVPLTAYVLIALLEAGAPADAPIVLQTTRCVLGDMTRDPYTIALTAYALALAGHPRYTAVLLQLLELAVEDDEGMYWEVQRMFYRSNSLAVESDTAGYAIMAMMANPERYLLDARKIVKWITTKRRGYGGFYSTQDTIVALQALASYETNTYEGKLDVVATVTSFSFRESEKVQQARSQQFQQSQKLQYKRPVPTVGNLVHEFIINEDSKLLQQQVSLPDFPTYVKISMEGQGCAVMQAELRYNVPVAEPSDAFSLKVDGGNAPGRDCARKRIRACSAYILIVEYIEYSSSDGEWNMAVIEVNLISGFIPVKDDLKAVVRRNPKVIKRYEVDGSKVSFYIEEFTAEEVCVAFNILREVEVENTKPGTVVVYDYYEPDFAVSTTLADFPYVEGCD